MTMRLNRRGLLIATFACCAVVAMTTAAARAGDVTWTITQGTGNFGGYERSGAGQPYFNFVSQGAGHKHHRKRIIHHDEYLYFQPRFRAETLLSTESPRHGRG